MVTISLYIQHSKDLFIGYYNAGVYIRSVVSDMTNTVFPAMPGFTRAC